MKEKTIFVSDDGTRFDTRSECESYEADCAALAAAMAPLGPDRKHELREYFYIQHEPAVVQKAWEEVRAILERVNPKTKGMMKWQFAIFFDDALAAYSHAIYRFECIRFSDGREFDQPYYATIGPSPLEKEMT